MDQMHPRTEATLEQLRNEEWFRNVGVQDTEVADVLSSWPEAIQSCGSPEWEDLCLEAVNQYCARLIERSVGEYGRWNEVARLVSPESKALVHAKTRDVVVKYNLPKVFIDAVNWDIHYLCMEAEFADVYPPGFYASQAYWYAKGHFPCGWRGPFPQGGRLVIY
jgi:hypothetical protein